MVDKPKKGVAGKNTGAKTRKAIEYAENKGFTQEQIARAANRSVSVISAIKSGEIANPPSNVSSMIRGNLQGKTPRKQLRDWVNG